MENGNNHHHQESVTTHHDQKHTHDHTDSIRRLKVAEGHLRGIQRMLEADEYCIDIIHQIQAVQAALNKVNVAILNQHLNSCVIKAMRGGDEKEREQVIKEIAEIFEVSKKT